MALFMTLALAKTMSSRTPPKQQHFLAEGIVKIADGVHCTLLMSQISVVAFQHRKKSPADAMTFKTNLVKKIEFSDISLKSFIRAAV